MGTGSIGQTHCRILSSFVERCGIILGRWDSFPRRELYRRYVDVDMRTCVRLRELGASLELDTADTMKREHELSASTARSPQRHMNSSCLRKCQHTLFCDSVKLVSLATALFFSATLLTTFFCNGVVPFCDSCHD